MKVPARVALLILALPIAVEAQQSAKSSPEKDMLAAYFRAYNAHDLDALMQFIDPEFVWFTVTADKTTTEVTGVEALRKGLASYFKSLPSSRSDAEVLGENGPWISVRETARWQSASGPRAQSSLSVYEVRNGKIRRVWYYPAIRE
jgi:hypothetical protein